MKDFSRRQFVVTAALATLGPVLPGPGAESSRETIVDIHQHTNYSGRTDADLVSHQRAMGITKTVLLPAGRLYGLAAQCGGNQTVFEVAQKFPREFCFFANEVPDLSGAREEISSYLKRGALGIGEQKFHLEVDSAPMRLIFELAQEFEVPVLMHFEHATYNMGLERFHEVLEKFPKVKFIGHAQTWWANIDKNHSDQKVLYPKTKVTPGGVTDRLLTDYPNMFGDLSAGSGLNALIRDEEHTRAFLERHQDKLMFGSDCNDVIGRGPGCQGAQTIAALRRLAPAPKIRSKLFSENALRILKVRI